MRESVKRHLSQALHSELSELLSRLRAEAPETYTPDTESVARRSLCSAVLALLCSAAQDDKPLTLAMNYYKEAKNMTDKVAALAALSSKRCAQRNFCFNDFYTTWQNDSLVVLKWLQMQVGWWCLSTIHIKCFHRNRKEVHICRERERFCLDLNWPGLNQIEPNRIETPCLNVLIQYDDRPRASFPATLKPLRRS